MAADATANRAAPQAVSRSASHPGAAAADVAIVGAGPVGLALACQLLRTTDARVLLIDAATPARAARDPRAIALSHGSRELLEPLGGWPADVTPIFHIHVSQRGHFGHVKLHHNDYDVPALGYVVRYGALCGALEQALTQAAAARPGQLVRAFETRIDHVEEDDPGMERPADSPDGVPGGMVRLHGVVQVRASTNGPAHGSVNGPAAGEITGQATFTARVAVQAEGSQFQQASGLAAARRRQRDYGQTAIVARVTCSQPLPGWAWERFTDEGPLALLPQDAHGEDRDAGAPAEHGYALVWCCSAEQAARRLALPEAHFLAELGTAFGSRMGRFTSTSARHAFALGLNAAPVTVRGRTAAIGNAAQTLHPVAGQGLNLGLRDAFSLAMSLREGCTPEALAAFAARHRLDRAVTIGMTDFLPRAFGVPGPLAAHARGASLAALACLIPLKNALARQMMYGTRN